MIHGGFLRSESDRMSLRRVRPCNLKSVSAKAKEY